MLECAVVHQQMIFVVAECSEAACRMVGHWPACWCLARCVGLSASTAANCSCRPQRRWWKRRSSFSTVWTLLSWRSTAWANAPVSRVCSLTSRHSCRVLSKRQDRTCHKCWTVQLGVTRHSYRHMCEYFWVSRRHFLVISVVATDIFTVIHQQTKHMNVIVSATSVCCLKMGCYS